MEPAGDRRRHPRTPPNDPMIGFVQVDTPGGPVSPSSAETRLSSFYVNVLNLSDKGALIESDYDLDGRSRLLLQVPASAHTVWRGCRARVAWARRDPGQDLCLAGLEFHGTVENPADTLDATNGDSIPQPDDLRFLLKTSLLDSIPERAAFHLLNCLRARTLRPGERLFSQGEEGDCLYIIENGKCSVKLEKDDGFSHLARLQEGDVVGEMAVLTGEPRSASVDAETDMKLWGLSNREFQRVSSGFPDLRFVLTELVTRRFEGEALSGDRHIGKYTIKNKLGMGGWSIVYHGIHKVLNAPVAVKMLKHNMAMEEGFLAKFRNEAQIIAGMNHKNIVRVYDIEELFQTLFIVMEYLDGQGLDSLIERLGRVPVPRAMGFLAQICEGLAYAHEKGIIHQDIKPANLFVQAHDQIKILDFGLACQPGSEDPNLAGTIFYAAPEQIEGLPVDVRTDIYALGITAYELLTGSRPYPEDDLGELVRMHLDRDIPDPREAVPDLPEALCRFILKSCRRNPDERYQTIGDALNDLKPLIAELCPSQERGTLEKARAINIFFLYRDQHQLDLNKLLEQFGAQLQELGLVMRVSTFEDL
jgi:eukaryotic-like serine/threonine-protein kinase